MPIRDHLPVFCRTFIVYIEQMFVPQYFTIVLELVLFGFSYSNKNKFNDFYLYFMDFHSNLVPIVVLYFLAYPFFSKIFTFKVVPREFYRMNKFNVPNRPIAIVTLVALLAYHKYPLFSICFPIIFSLLYIIDGQIDIIQAIVSIALEIAVFYLRLQYPYYAKISVYSLSIFLSALFLLIKKSQTLIFKNDLPSFITQIIQNFGVLVFDAIITSKYEKNPTLATIALFSNYVIHVCSYYSKIFL